MKKKSYGAHPEKKGALHRMLGISPDEKIPTMLLREVLSKNLGTHMLSHGKRVAITRLLKQRAAFALSFR